MITNCVAKLMRLVYVDKVAKGKECLASFPGYLTVVKEENEILEGRKFGKVYKLSIGKIIDIKESDGIVIDDEEYAVKGVGCRKSGNLELTTVILERGK